jgi:hypothetical protein
MGVNPGGLFVAGGDLEQERDGCAMAHGTQRTRRVYTGWGLQRVKLYVLFLIVLLWMRLNLSREDALVRLILADGQGWWTQSPGRLQYENLSKVGYNIIP